MEDSTSSPCGSWRCLATSGQGMQAKGIARVMGISVHGYIKTVYTKLQVSSRIEALNRGRQLQLLT